MSNINGTDMTFADLTQQGPFEGYLTRWGSFISIGSGSGDAPKIQNISPTPGTAISPSAFLQFDVVDAGGSIVLVVPVVTLDPTVAGERAYDWSGTVVAPGGSPPGSAPNAGPGVFEAAYALNSTVVAIAGGYRFRIRRRNGWQTPPTLRVYAVNALGNATVV